MLGWKVNLKPGYDAARLYFGASRASQTCWEWDLQERMFGSPEVKGGCLFTGDLILCLPRHERHLKMFIGDCTDDPWEPVEPDVQKFQRHRQVLERMYEASMTAWWRLPVQYHAEFANLAGYMVTGILGGFGPCSDSDFERIGYINQHSLVGITPEAACRFAEEWVYPANPHMIPIRETLNMEKEKTARDLMFCSEAEIAAAGFETCPNCNGYGSSLKENAAVCTKCGGVGLSKKEDK